MYRKLLKFSLVCVTGALLFTANPNTAMAYEEAIAGFIHDKDSTDNSNGASITTLSIYEIPIPGYSNIGIANVDTNLSIRSGAGENYKIIGKLPKNGGCEIIKEEKDGWIKITAKTSTTVLTGYVSADYLIVGAQATKLAKEVGNNVATAKVDQLCVRSQPSTDSSKLDFISKGEELSVLDAKIITDDNEHRKWVQVRLESEDDEDGKIGYVAKEYVELSFELIKAVSMKELEYGSGVSSIRVRLIDFAKDYLGGRYVWGGTSLGKGVDCSGFTQAVYRNMGISINRTSRAQASSGTKVSASNLKPGDLVFYGSSSYINHVAIYIGNGKIIHASNKRDGIKISNLNYRTPITCRKYIND